MATFLRNLTHVRRSSGWRMHPHGGQILRSPSEVFAGHKPKVAASPLQAMELAGVHSNHNVRADT